MERKSFVFLLVLLSLVLAVSPRIHALWIENGVALRNTTGHSGPARIISDGFGGAIIVWDDHRLGYGESDVYIQRVDAAGNVRWTTDGVPISTDPLNQADSDIASDGAGGAIIVWLDNEGDSNHVYTQRVDAGGNIQWTEGGVAICLAPHEQYNPEIIADGEGGAIITWIDYRNANDYDIYAQKINRYGIVQWQSDGEPVCTVVGHQAFPMMIPDGSGGAIITWCDERDSGNYDIYAQMVNAEGNMKWTAGGINICNANFNQDLPMIASDGAGGAIIAWRDERTMFRDIYARRIDSGGNVHWTTDGVAICTASGDQDDPEIIYDGAGAAIITWWDTRNGNEDIYVQKVDTSGTVQWAADGLPVCQFIGDQHEPQLIADGSGGAIITWMDARTHIDNNNIYVQHVDPAGNFSWTDGGVAICLADEDQYYPYLISDGVGGAIITWWDYRTAMTTDVYAQLIDARGEVGNVPPAIYSILDLADDEGGVVNITWDASAADLYGREITRYTIWRAIDPEQAAMLLESGAALLFSDEQIDPGTGGFVLRSCLLNGQAYFWDLISSVDAYFLEKYSELVPTAFDSSATSDGYNYFQIIAHTGDPGIFFISDPDSGYSVDNLAPCPPACLAGEQSFEPIGLDLTWAPNEELDLDFYALYRGTDPGFAPSPGNLVTSTCDTCYFDSGWTWDGGYCYKVAAVDVHGNESGYTLLCSDNITGEEPPATPLASYLTQNHPNPFNPSTTITFGLSAPEHVSLRIYDAAGRLVRVLLEDRREAGVYNETWNGRDDSGREVASGVYFYSLNAGRFKETKKMVLLK